MHVHVTPGDGEAKFWLEPEIELSKNYHYSRKQLKYLSRRITMNSHADGKSISAVEVTNVSSHGIWLLAHGKELFISYADFPWFKDQAIKSILNVVEESPGHFYWPDIDVDLTEQIIEHPERFPLKAKNI